MHIVIINTVYFKSMDAGASGFSWTLNLVCNESGALTFPS